MTNQETGSQQPNPGPLASLRLSGTRHKLNRTQQPATDSETAGRPPPLRRLGQRFSATYADCMFLFVLLVIIVAAVVAYKFRVPLLAKILGQSESRVQRSIERRKR